MGAFLTAGPAQQQQMPGAAAPTTPAKGGKGQQGKGNAGGKGGKGGGGGKGGEDSLLRAVAQLSLENASSIREINATLVTILLAPISAPPVVKALLEGQVYNLAAKRRKGENLGSPHVKIGLCFFQELGAMPAVMNDPVMKQTLEGWWRDEIVGASADTRASEMIVFKIRKPQKATKQKMTGTAAELNEYAKITLAMGPRSQAFLGSFKRFASEELE